MPKRASSKSSSSKTAERDVIPPGTDVSDGSLFFNRELSWLAFNNRVLQLAEDPSVPLLERVKFCAIYARNLDEFFMIRVARLHEQMSNRVARLVPDGATPGETLGKMHERILEQGNRHSDCFERQLRPALADKGIRIFSMKELDAEGRAQVEQRFREQIFPVLTPLAIGLGRHFPYISNLSLSLAVLLRDPVTDTENVARVKVPKELLSRFVPLKGGTSFVPLEEVIAHNLGTLFPGMEVLDQGLFRVTRDADFTVSEDAEDLLVAVQTELRQRRFGDVIRLEYQAGMNPKLLEPLMEALSLEPQHLYEERGLLDLSDVMAIVATPGFAELRDPPWTPVTQPRLQSEDDGEVTPVMTAMRRGALLVHHPYESFTTSVERFVTEAVEDPDVLAIKQTVYRTSDKSPLVPALIRATERGKQAVCMVELKARFDERTNIRWALALEEAGVHVVYGIPGLKTHAKAILIVRREGEKVRHYVHVGTGNYNSKTARLYTDLGLFTTDPDIGADVADLFNFLTGFARPKTFRKLLVAPVNMREGLLEEVRRTIAQHTPENPSRILLKMNALVDPVMIRALYDASSAGVKVELNIRGICCLRPQVPGVSENIRVVSTLGRFLEHSRVYLFERGGETRCYIGSADLMPRNLDHRVEALTPVEDPTLIAQVRDIIERCLAENTHAWVLQADGSWLRRPPEGEKRWAQQELMERAVRMAQASTGRPLP
ncbi:polyphosphate kinase 1 [Cystobacter ferrugineus]|uniref:Polyphosphate kinase n=1 Tax=Cystobacter ferrugineus TaxID=83449 RepID=A0A1L9B8R2_9BACT|nr:polyphosphate kinase 1 [Cystobacter ferrugineus]OJH38650.1 RNA degradosome polyphosphate kinase [Cystobacter ferrugineus]